MLSNLIETLATELERPRELSPRVQNYIEGTYGVDHDAIGAFLVTDLSSLEDYEIDLILSPVFTPKLADQAPFAELLGKDSIPREQWPGLVQALVERPTRAVLVTSDSRRHAVPLRDVTIERYVYRLRLDATIPAPLFKVIEQQMPAGDRPMLKTIARSAVWDTDACRNILERYLQAAVEQKTYSIEDANELLNVVENHKPAGIEDLMARIPKRLEALREQIDTASGPKPFFNERVQEMHGGDRDQRIHEDHRLSAKRIEFEFLGRLQKIL